MEDVSGTRTPAIAAGTADRQEAVRPWTRREILAVAFSSAAGLGLMLIGITRPSFWFDEAATISGARRPLSSLWAMVQNVDAVHALYYVLMHGVLSVAEPTELLVRLPSAIAVALTLPVLYAIGRRLGSRTVGAIGAMIFLATPRVTWMATEGRSFAIATLLASVLVLIVLAALDRGKWWRHLLVVVTAVIGTVLFVYVGMLTGALALAALMYRVPRRRKAAVLGALAAALVIVAPFVLWVASQRGQLGGVKPTGLQLPRFLFVDQFFLDQTWLAVAVAGVMAVLVAVAAYRTRATNRQPTVHDTRFTVVLLGAWLVLPPLVIVVVSRVLGSSIYQPRAFAFTAPAFALIFAWVLVDALGRRWAFVAAVALVVACIPAYAQVRDETAKEQSDWRAAADVVASQTDPGTAIVYVGNDAVPWSVNEQAWVLPAAYSSRVAGVSDPLLIRPARATAGLWDERIPPTEAGRILTENRVLVVRGTPDDAPESIGVAQSLESAGFRRESAVALDVTHVDLWVRG